MDELKRNKKKQMAALCCGLLGCLCFGTGDWLMMCADPTPLGELYWLTAGTAQIPPWRYTLAMVLAFPGILLYGTALFSLERYILLSKQKNTYHTLTVYGLTPWLCLHLFYVMILFAFGWMQNHGYAAAALPTCEALYRQFSWLPAVSEVLMVPPFLYWFYLQMKGETVFPKPMAFISVLVFYGVLYLVKSLLPISAFRLGFTNGLMSESMLLWFCVLLLWTARKTAGNGKP